MNGTYCLGEKDFSGISGGTVWTNNGWKMTGGGRVSGKTSFNLLGGYVEFDMDTSGSHNGVNNNFYTTSPTSCCSYCDIQANSSPQCMEMDIIENNGNCLAQSTWHTWPNHNGGCDEGGCGGTKYLPAGGKFHMKAVFSADGWMSVSLNGAEITVNPTPSKAAQQYVATTMKSVGAMFESSQWVGWVPGGNCPGGGGLDSSVFGVYNVRVSGTVVQGQAPTRC